MYLCNTVKIYKKNMENMHFIFKTAILIYCAPCQIFFYSALNINSTTS